MARVNTTKAVNAWRYGNSAHPARSIWSNGSEVYSYGTRLLWRDGLTTFLNVRRYSNTTTRHQSGIRELLSEWNLVELDGQNYEEDTRAKQVDAEIAAEQARAKLFRKAVRAELRAAAQALTLASNRLSEAKANAQLALSYQERTFGGAAKYL